MALFYTAPHESSQSFKVGARRLDIQDFNRQPDVEARAMLTRCCGSARWVEAMMAARPFASFAELFRVSDDLWWQMEAADWREAFSHHSQLQPAVASPASETVQQGLRQGQADYVAKFGYPFILNAAGRSAAEVLAELQKRLRHEPLREFQIAAEHQRQLTTHRLMGWLTS